MPITPQIGAKKYCKYVPRKLLKGACTWKGQKYTKGESLGHLSPALVSQYKMHILTLQHWYFRVAIVAKRPFFGCGSRCRTLQCQTWLWLGKTNYQVYWWETNSKPIFNHIPNTSSWSSNSNSICNIASPLFVASMAGMNNGHPNPQDHCMITSVCYSVNNNEPNPPSLPMQGEEAIKWRDVPFSLIVGY